MHTPSTLLDDKYKLMNILIKLLFFMHFINRLLNNVNKYATFICLIKYIFHFIVFIVPFSI